MEYKVYAISSVGRKYIYVGLTSNLEERINRHNKGYEKTTKPYAPFRLIYSEECSNREEARKREKYWKSGIDKEKLIIFARMIEQFTIALVFCSGNF